VFVEQGIEITIEVENPDLTCGWLQSEVTRKYYEELEAHAYEEQSNPQPIKTTNKDESLKIIHDFRRNTRE